MCHFYFMSDFWWSFKTTLESFLKLYSRKRQIEFFPSTLKFKFSFKLAFFRTWVGADLEGSLPVRLRGLLVSGTSWENVCRWKVKQYNGSSHHVTLTHWALTSGVNRWLCALCSPVDAPRDTSMGRFWIVLVEPALLALRDTMKGELDTGHWHFISLLSQTSYFILKI